LRLNLSKIEKSKEKEGAVVYSRRRWIEKETSATVGGGAERPSCSRPVSASGLRQGFWSRNTGVTRNAAYDCARWKKLRSTRLLRKSTRNYGKQVKGNENEAAAEKAVV